MNMEMGSPISYGCSSTNSVISTAFLHCLISPQLPLKSHRGCTSEQGSAQEWLEPKFLSHGIRSWWYTLEYIQRTLVRLLKVFLINIASLQVVSSQIIDVCRLYMGKRVVSFTIVYCWFSTLSTSANLFYHGKRWFCVVFFSQDWKLSFSFFFFFSLIKGTK